MTCIPSNQPKVGIKAETSFGVALDSTGNDGTAYRVLPQTQAQKPQFNAQRESRLLSGRGSLKNAADTFITHRGGTVVTPFDFWATPQLFAQMIALVGQEHSETSVGSFWKHETEFDSSSNGQCIGGTITGNLPASVNLAYYLDGAGQDILVCGNIVNELTMSCAVGQNNGLITLSGNFFSGHCNPVSGTTNIEQTQDGTWSPARIEYLSIHKVLTKTLDVDGSSQSMVLSSFDLTINNGAVVQGSGDANGNAEGLFLPEFQITGNLGVKFDDTINYGAGENVIQDFIDGDTLSLQLIIGSGLDAVGEFQLDAELQYTGDPALTDNDGALFHNLPFEVVQNSTTEGLKIQIVNGEQATAW